MATKHCTQSFHEGMFVREYRAEGAFCVPIVYIHGLGESGLCYEKLVSSGTLTRGMLHLIVDLPGYGKSGQQDKVLSFNAIADHLALWLKKQDITKAILIGHSMGGVLGLIMAERHKQLVAGLVDIEGNKSLGDCVFSGQAMGVSYPDFKNRVFPQLLDKVYKDGLKDQALRGYYASLRFADPRSFYHHARELVRISKTESLAQRLAKLQVPTLYLAAVPRGICERSHGLLKQHGCSVKIVEPAGHWPFIEQPNQVIPLIAGFIRRVCLEPTD